MSIGQELGGYPSEDMTHVDLVDHVANLQKTVEYYLGGQIGSSNAREFGGFYIKPTTIMSKNGNVGLHSGTGTNPVRIWAGGTDMTTASFRVYDNGSVNISKGTISWGASGVAPPVYTAADVGALASNSPMLTNIGPTGIYTGTLNANQINVGTLTGFTIQTGGGTQRIVMDPSGFRSIDAAGRSRISIPFTDSGFTNQSLLFRSSTNVIRGTMDTDDLGFFVQSSGKLNLIANDGNMDITAAGGKITFVATNGIDFNNQTILNFTGVARFG